MDKDMIFKLETADTRRCGTVRVTTWSAIFVQRNSNQINDTERRVIRMIEEEPEPSSWTCGCVTGYPDTMFTDDDRNLLFRYGIGHRFEI